MHNTTSDYGDAFASISTAAHAASIGTPIYQAAMTSRRSDVEEL